jgi:hypothetical protein
LNPPANMGVWYSVTLGEVGYTDFPRYGASGRDFG